MNEFDSRLGYVKTQQVISDLSYKPGWTFGFEPGRFFQPPRLIIHAEVLDSNDPERTIRFTMKRIIPKIIKDETQFVSWWEDIVVEAEIHEVREFLRYKGKLIDDPHKSELVKQIRKCCDTPWNSSHTGMCKNSMIRSGSMENMLVNE